MRFLGLTATCTSCKLYPVIARVLSSSGRIDRLRIEDAEEVLLRSATTLGWKASQTAFSEISFVVLSWV